MIMGFVNQTNFNMTNELMPEVHLNLDNYAQFLNELNNKIEIEGEGDNLGSEGSGRAQGISVEQISQYYNIAQEYVSVDSLLNVVMTTQSTLGSILTFTCTHLLTIAITLSNFAYYAFLYFTLLFFLVNSKMGPVDWISVMVPAKE